MTSKEKANDLFNKFNNTDLSEMGEDYQKDDAKSCSLICVKELISLLEYCYGSQKHMWTSNENENYKYWQEVKGFIEAY